MDEANDIFKKIDALIRTRCVGKFYSDYCAGITNDIERRVSKEHNVDIKECNWSHLCSSKEVAEKVEKMFLDKGMIGSHGGGTEKSIYIYVYRITGLTIEAPSLVDAQQLLEGKKMVPTVEFYSSTHLFGDRLWKVRLVGKKQVKWWGLNDQKEKGKRIAEEFAKQENTVFEERSPEGALTIKR